MPEVICTTVYHFPELSDRAKDKARAWYRDLGPHDNWWDAVYDDFERVCDILGIRIKTRSVRLMGGGTRQKPCVRFSGFWSQRDGASYEGFWSHAKGSTKRIRDYAAQDATLHGIADRLQAVQRRNFYQLVAEASHRGRYSTEYCMTIEVMRDSPTGHEPTSDSDSDSDSEDGVTEALRDLARWLYRQLETEHDYFTSDAAVEDGSIINEHTFTEAGWRFGQPGGERPVPTLWAPVFEFIWSLHLVHMIYVGSIGVRNASCSKSPRTRPDQRCRAEGLCTRGRCLGP